MSFISPNLNTMDLGVIIPNFSTSSLHSDLLNVNLDCLALDDV